MGEIDINSPSPINPSLITIGPVSYESLSSPYNIEEDKYQELWNQYTS